MGKLIIVFGLLALALAVSARVDTCDTAECANCKSDHCKGADGPPGSNSCCCVPDTSFACDSARDCGSRCAENEQCLNALGTCLCIGGCVA